MSAPRIRVEGERVEIDVRERGGAAPVVVESGPGWRMRLVLRGSPLAWARVQEGWRGIAWARAEPSATLGLVPPITAANARGTEPEKWPLRFGEALAASSLGPTTWALVPLAPLRDPYDRDALGAPEAPVARGLVSALEVPAAVALSFGLHGSGRVLPLRTASPPESARVKAWRKHARDGTLPPVLLLWLSMLDVWVALDGHDRLLAARLEGMRPEALGLFAVSEDDAGWAATDRDRARDAASTRYARAFRAEPVLQPRTRLELNRDLVGAWCDWRARRASTIARYRSDLADRFAADLGGQSLPDGVRALLLA